MEHTAEAVCLVNADGRVADWNPAMAQLAGCSVAHARGRPLVQVWPAATGPLADACAAAAHTGTTAKLTLTHRDKLLAAAVAPCASGALVLVRPAAPAPKAAPAPRTPLTPRGTPAPDDPDDLLVLLPPDHPARPRLVARWEYHPADGRITHGPDLLEVLGLPADFGPLDSARIDALQHPDDRRRGPEAFHAAMTSPDGLFVNHYRFLPPGGAERTIRSVGRVIRDAQGHALTMRAVSACVSPTLRPAWDSAHRAQHLEALVRAAGVALWELDLVRQVLHHSPELFDLYGLPRDRPPVTLDELRTRIKHPDDAERSSHAAPDAAASPDGVYANRYRAIRPDGTVAHIRTSGRVLRDASGRALSIIGVCFDVTEIEESHAAARLAARQAELALEAAGMALWSYDFAARVYRLSDGMAALLGHPPAALELGDAEMAALVHSDSLPSRARSLEQALADPHGHFFTENRIRCASGEYAWLRCRGRVERDAQGRPTLLRAVAQNITNQLHLEDENRQRAALLAMSAKAARIAPVIVDCQTGIHTHGPELLDFLGFPADHGPINSAVWRDRIHPDDRAAAIARRDHQLASGSTEYRNAYRLLLPDGRIRWVRVAQTIERDERGNAVRLVGAVSDVSDLHEARRAAEESAASVDLLQQTGSTGGWRLTREGTFHYDAAWAALMALPGGAGSMPLAELLERTHHESRARTQASCRAVYAGQTERVCDDHRVRGGDGRYRHLQCRGVAERDGKGEVVAIRGASVDRTGMVEADEAAREAHRRLAVAAEAARISPWEWDLESGVLHFTESMAALFGLEASIRAAPAESLMAGIHPDDRPAVAAVIDTAMTRGGDLEAFGYRVLRPDGSVRHVNCHGTFMPGEVGRKGRIVGLSMDITERVRAENAARSAERRAATAIEAAGLGEWTWDTATGHVRHNARLAEMFALPADPAGTGEAAFFARVHPEDLPRVRAATDALGLGQDGLDLAPFRVVHPDGSMRWVRAVGRRVADERGRPTPVFAGISIDATDQRRAIEVLERSNEDLERVVRERTDELSRSHEHLRVSERLATVGTLAAGLGHDLGNLLLPMRCELDVLRAGIADAGQRERVDKIKRAAEYLAKLSQSLRALALDPDEAQGADAGVSLDEWWRSAEPLLRGAVPRGVLFEAKIAPGLPPVRPGKPGLSQATLNLLLNAVEAVRDKPEARITLEVRPAARGGAVDLCVTDNGGGMSDEVKRRATEPFFTTKPRSLSTGLGLSLVESIVRSAGGGISITSGPDEGTEVKLTLPAAAP